MIVYLLPKHSVGFADECDRLSEIAAVKSGKRHWGRWVLNQQGGFDSLDTLDVIPTAHGSSERQTYWIELTAIDKGGIAKGCDGKTWMEHFAKKNWVGAKGIRRTSAWRLTS